MNAGQLLLIARDLITLLVNVGILRVDGTFDQTKLDTLQEDLAFAAAVEAMLAARGLSLPDRVEKIIAILPLVAGLVA